MAYTEQQWWLVLAQLLNKGDLTTFWATYATYLKERNIISTARQILYNAALQTFMRLQGKWIAAEELNTEGWYWYYEKPNLNPIEVLYSDVKEEYYCVFSQANSLTWCKELPGKFMVIPEPEGDLNEPTRPNSVDVPRNNV